MGLNGTLDEDKIRTCKLLNVRNLASAIVPLRPTTVQMLNLELIETKRITVWCFLDCDDTVTQDDNSVDLDVLSIMINEAADI